MVILRLVEVAGEGRTKILQLAYLISHCSSSFSEGETTEKVSGKVEIACGTKLRLDDHSSETVTFAMGLVSSGGEIAPHFRSRWQTIQKSKSASI
jgi:hypothetical protein